MVDECAGSGDERNLYKNQELLDVQLCSLRVQGRGSVLVCGDRGDEVSNTERVESESCFSSPKTVVVFHPEYSITRTILFRSRLSVASVMLSSEGRRESQSLCLLESGHGGSTSSNGSSGNSASCSSLFKSLPLGSPGDILCHGDSASWPSLFDLRDQWD
jgi:hypothetical protein